MVVLVGALVLRKEDAFNLTSQRFGVFEKRLADLKEGAQRIGS